MPEYANVNTFLNNYKSKKYHTVRLIGAVRRFFVFWLLVSFGVDEQRNNMGIFGTRCFFGEWRKSQ